LRIFWKVVLQSAFELLSLFFFDFDSILIVVSPLPLDFISLLMQTEQFAIILYILFPKGTVFAKLSARIDHEHLVGFFLPDVPHNEIFNELAGRYAELFGFGQVEPSQIDCYFWLQVPSVNEVDDCLVLQLHLALFIGRGQLLAVVVEDLVLGRHSEAVSDELDDLREVGDARRVDQEGLLAVVTDVEV
jgi:hypothetical protein